MKKKTLQWEEQINGKLGKIKELEETVIKTRKLQEGIFGKKSYEYRNRFEKKK